MMLAHGFTNTMLDASVRDGLATAEQREMRAGRQPIQFPISAVTAGGRRAAISLVLTYPVIWYDTRTPFIVAFDDYDGRAEKSAVCDDVSNVVWNSTAQQSHPDAIRCSLRQHLAACTNSAWHRCW